ncbi:MAG: sulfatase [Candidatus Brocadiia bacterium]
MADRLNLLIVHCHDLGQYLHCYGKETVRSPNLDAFAREGVRFENHFCTAPQCSPSRASIFTGRYPHCNGVMGLAQPPLNWELNEDEIHLGQVLNSAGYRTAAIGVIHETHSGPERCGYQEYHRDRYARPAADRACGLLPGLAAGEEPFYLSVGFVEPHKLPYEDREGWLPRDHSWPGEHLEPDDGLGVDVPPYIADTPGARQEVAGLQGAVRHVDAQFGRIYAKAKECGLCENAVIVFTTDHGIAMPRAKCSLYEPGVNTALIMRAPREGWREGAVYEELISNIDLVPSVLELLNVETPEKVQGRSFRPLVEGGEYRKNEQLFTEMTYHTYYDPMRAIRTEGYKLIACFSTAPRFMEPGQRRRPLSDPWYAPETGHGGFHQDMELYDLEKDPWEKHDVSGTEAYAEVKQELMQRLYQQMVRTDDPLLEGAVPDPQYTTTMQMLRQA